MDKYDEQIERLMALDAEEFETISQEQWSNSEGLFAYARRGGGYLDADRFYGCLTMIRSDKTRSCEWLDLEERIRNDSRLPDNPDDIKQDRTMLTAFAEYQREMDQRHAKGE